MAQHDRTIEDVLVVGGGDVGLVTGLSVRQLNPDVGVTIVDNFGESAPKVGKSTYQAIVDLLHGFLEIPEDRFLQEVKPIWKGSVYFTDWCGYDPFHYTFDFFVQYPETASRNAAEQYYHHYDSVSRDPTRRTVSEAMVEEQKSPIYFDSDGHSRYQAVAYHLDLHRFNAFLRDLCTERGISLVDDEVVDVETDGVRVENVRGTDQTYDADLYVDASGFNRIIKDRQESAFREFELPLDSAVTAKFERSLSDAVPATVIESGDAGWFWQIDTFDYRDIGYVFGSEFINEDEAVSEFLTHCGGVFDEDDLTRYEFTSGYYENAWEGNCIAIGNTQGFVEPLQSTALTANAQAAAKLSIALSSQGRVDYTGTRDRYNAWVRQLWESIYDFVSVHYRHSSGESPFWEAARSVPVSDRVERLEAHFDHCGYNTSISPIETAPADGDPLDDIVVFAPINFYIIMRNMGVDSAFYEGNAFDVGEEVREKTERLYDSMEQKADRLLSLEEVYDGLFQVA